MTTSTSKGMKMKLCKDCAHFDIGLLQNSDFAKCTLTRKMSPVTGEVGYSSSEYIYCSTQRMGAKCLCGIEGRFWEPRDVGA